MAYPARRNVPLLTCSPRATQVSMNASIGGARPSHAFSMLHSLVGSGAVLAIHPRKERARDCFAIPEIEWWNGLAICRCAASQENASSIRRFTSHPIEAPYVWLKSVPHEAWVRKMQTFNFPSSL